MTDNPFITNVTLDTFPALVIDRSQQVPVVVDFWATWCAPCQVLMPLLARLSQEYQGKFVLAKVNTDQERDLAQQYGVRNLPTVKIFRHGKVVAEFMGAQPESVVRSYLDRYIDRKSDQLRQQAATARQQGDLDSALGYLRQATELEPNNQEIQIELAQLFVEQDDLSSARSILNAFPDDQSKVQTLISYIEFAEIARNVNHPAMETRLATDSLDHEARYCLAMEWVVAKKYQEAMDYLLEIVRHDREFRNDGARKALLTIFELLGNDHDLVTRYRKRLLNLLH